jgi:hypothetical protein
VVLTAHYDSKWFPNFPQNQVCPISSYSPPLSCHPPTLLLAHPSTLLGYLVILPSRANDPFSLELLRSLSLRSNAANNQFVGATDSAAPCAMLLDLAESLTPLLKARHDRVTSQQGILRDGFDEEESSDTTLTILFLDGEEAFHDWTDTDSIYGAYIETIDHFILLDLLGNSHSRLHSYYRETDWLFDEMADVDRRLREEGLVEVEKGEEEWFQKLRMRPGMIGDDHLPVCPFFNCCSFFHSSILSYSQFVSRPSAYFFYDERKLISVRPQRRFGPTCHFKPLPTSLAHPRSKSPLHLLPSQDES